MKRVPIDILLIEDNPGHVELIRKSLSQDKLLVNLHTVGDGKRALDFLHKKNDYPNAVRPDMIVLDLTLPGVDGREILAEIKADDDLKAIPVVVLTSSQAELDIVQSYELHANSYVAKPVEVDDLMTVVRGIEDFWVQIVKLP